MATNIIAFTPLSSSAALTVGTTSSNALIPSTNTLPNLVSLRIVNVGANAVYIAFGGSAVTAVIPVVGTNEPGLMLAPNSVAYVMVQSGYSEDNPDNTPSNYIACIAASAGNSLYITVGGSGIGG